MGIAEAIEIGLPLGVQATKALIDIIESAQAAGRTHFTQADEDAYYAATGKSLADFDAAQGKQS